MVAAFTPGEAKQWHSAVPSEWWWVPVLALGAVAGLLSVGSTDRTPFVVGVLLAAGMLLCLWPALGAAVAVGAAVTMPLVGALPRVQVAVAAFAASSLLLLGLRVAGQLRQLRIAETAARTQSVPHRPRVLGPWRWRRALAAIAGLVALGVGVWLTIAATASASVAPWAGLLVPPAAAVALLMGRLVTAPYLWPNRWAGVALEAQVWPDGVVALRAAGDRVAVARYLASLPESVSASAAASLAPANAPTAPAQPAAPPSPYPQPSAWQTVRRLPPQPTPPVTTSAAAATPHSPQPEPGPPWHAVDAVGDLRDGGWAAVVLDGVTLHPIAPLQGIAELGDVVQRVAQAGARTGFDRFKVTTGLLLGGFVLMMAGLFGAAGEWEVATGHGTHGRITITERHCSQDGRSRTCTSYGRFVSDDGGSLRDDVSFDRDSSVGTTQRAVLTSRGDIETPTSSDFAFFAGLSGVGMTLLLVWGLRVVGRHRKPWSSRWQPGSGGRKAP